MIDRVRSEIDDEVGAFRRRQVLVLLLSVKELIRLIERILYILLLFIKRLVCWIIALAEAFPN